MNLMEARREVMANADAGNATLIESGSGIGKSQMLWSIFEEIRDRDAAKGIRWGANIIFMATQQPTDLVGCLWKGEKTYETIDGQQITVTVTDPSMPLWMMMSDGKGGPRMPAFLFDKCFLIIDEYGQGEGDTKRGGAELFLNGGTPPWYLPAGSIRVAASNAGSRYGVSKDFDFCIARRSVIHVDGDTELWLRFADKPYHFQGKSWQTTPVVKAWAAANPQLLFEVEPKEQGPWCNPRQLCAVDRYLQVKWEHQGSQEITPSMIQMVAGTIGMPSTQSLLSHLEFVTQLPSYAEVIADPANTVVPQRADLQMLMAYQMAGYTKVADIAACVQYIQRFPKSLGVTYISALLRRDYTGLVNHPAMQAWIAKNAALLAVIAAL